MSWETREVARAAACAALAAGIVLAGCTTTSKNSSSPYGTGPSANETKDRVTASDESEGARRARVRLELASAYFSRSQFTTALDEVKLAIASDPRNAAAFNLRGLIYASLGDEQLADESFRHALQIDPRDADTMQNYGWYLCQRKRYQEADGMFRQALAVPQYRDAPRTLLTEGICQARAGDWSQAEGTLTRSYRRQPERCALSPRRIRARALPHPSRQRQPGSRQCADALARGAHREPPRQPAGRAGVRHAAAQPLPALAGGRRFRPGAVR